MITTIMLANTSITSHDYHFLYSDLLMSEIGVDVSWSKSRQKAISNIALEKGKDLKARENCDKEVSVFKM